MAAQQRRERVETLVIGGGQAGLAMGYQLSRRSLPYTIVDANDRIGDAWRNRWDSFRLFTPNRLNHLPGMAFPGYHWGFPSKNEMADYLDAYARRFGIPVETGVRVERLTREGGRFVAIAGDRRLEADNVVIAMSSWQRPRVPGFASELDPRIVQLHVAEYKNPGQLQDGDVLVVGAGNSGAEIAIEVARTHKVVLSGPSTGAIPFRPESVAGRVLMPFIGRVVFHQGAHDRHPDRQEGPLQDDHVWRTADPGQAQGPGGSGGRARSSGHGCRRRPAAPRGRAIPGCRQRRLVHGVPTELLVDRPPCARGRRADPRSRDRQIGAGPLLHRSQVPLFGLLRADPRGGKRRRSHRSADRRPPHRSIRGRVTAGASARQQL